MRPLTGVTIATILGVLPIGLACSSSPTSPSTTSTTTLPAMFQQFKNGVSVSLSGSTVVLTSKGVPDHKSPYWGAGNALYEAPQDGMQVNPNLIASQNFVITIPLSPASTTASDTPLGAIGMAVNGVALFNQYAAGRQPLTFEILSFDRYNGHPQQTGVYHYHMNPVSITAVSLSGLVGVLLDGFPVYGPEDTTGGTPTGLDTCNGHTHATPEFPSGIYHYHVTGGVPYIAGCFRGKPGTSTQ